MASDDALALLRSIDATLKLLLAQTKTVSPKPVASDRDLDGQYGDPELRFMPRDWTGENYKGLHFSEYPAELLDMVAETFDYFAEKAARDGELTSGGKPVAPYKQRDAARARGWAARVRAGYTPPSASDNGDLGHDDAFDDDATLTGPISEFDDIPF